MADPELLQQQSLALSSSPSRGTAAPSPAAFPSAVSSRPPPAMFFLSVVTMVFRD
uniref:Uncharacterized protein n=1 Tax=Serinus canaria TaxID=9135 RepID=A0A8C9MKC7_SERCA